MERELGWGIETGPNYGCTKMNGFMVCGEQYGAEGERVYCPEHLAKASGPRHVTHGDVSKCLAGDHSECSGGTVPAPRFPVGRCKHCGQNVLDAPQDGQTIIFCSYECYCMD
jgi:hypothetical protein